MFRGKVAYLSNLATHNEGQKAPGTMQIYGSRMYSVLGFMTSNIYFELKFVHLNELSVPKQKHTSILPLKLTNIFGFPVLILLHKKTAFK